ncbi:fimbria/pilus outer membrane usher protein [Yokenella regensburgei]|uniref:fimbria/pilus outer membrane usher protein n=1 Tax=Yokenella regensburgei TaxID=158877 RepID=UPI001432D313|nr:fimbria/pilus outer membrane usher protein [Yokenella regensburgei]QIU88424.1 fimbrial biogenesis outer membrane usher protein [Yokenella regensburgei]
MNVYAGSDFEEAFLRRDKNGVSQDVFIYQDSVMPGRRLTDIVINDRSAGKVEIDFVNSGNNHIIPCLSRSQLKSVGIRVSLYSGWVTDEKDDGVSGLKHCEMLEQRIPAAVVKYDNTHQVLNIIVPQEALNNQRFTMISPTEWDHGVPSLRTSYSGYFYSSRVKGSSGPGWRTDDVTSESAWLSLHTTGSLGAWRLYSIDSFYRNDLHQWKSLHDRSYLARDIEFLRSSLLAGEIYTRAFGTMTGSIPLRGISLSTSEHMSLDNQYSYAPVIRGVARTNARLTVRQRGTVIYSTLLTPGTFAIDDIYTAQVGSDLDVTVEESDGQVRAFRVPYTALPGMIRPGTTRYSVAVGTWRSAGSVASEPVLMTGSLEYGFEHFTLNSSSVMAEYYQMLSVGAAWNIGAIGAFSAELAHARHTETWLDNNNREGSAARLLYARQFDHTGTSLQLLGWQYQSESFLDAGEFLVRQGRSWIDDYALENASRQKRRRNRLEMTISQNMNSTGNLYMTMSQERFYGTGKKNTSISAGVGTSLGPVSASLSLTNNHYDSISDNQVNLSLSLPLSVLSSGRGNSGFLSYGLSRNRNNQYSQSLGYAGNSIDNDFSYTATVQRDALGEYSQSGALGWNGSRANITGTVSHGRDYRQYSTGISGGLTLWQGGVLMSPPLGSTIAIVETPGAENVGVSGTNNARTNASGQAVVTWLTPYRYNQINLDAGVSDGAELKDTSRKVVPTEGAAILLRFATRAGRRALVEIYSQKNIPLGAMVYTKNETEEAGIVGSKGLVWLTGLDTRDAQELNVMWGQKKEEQCRITLPAPHQEQLRPENWYQKIRVKCL